MVLISLAIETEQFFVEVSMVEYSPILSIYDIISSDFLDVHPHLASTLLWFILSGKTMPLKTVLATVYGPEMRHLF
jgi:hypothetical protein